MNARDDDSIETELLASQAVVAVFRRLMRIRIATQDGHQKRMTLDSLRAAFQEELSGHISQVLVDGVLSPEGARFRAAFSKLQDHFMTEVASGLTAEEMQRLDPL